MVANGHFCSLTLSTVWYELFLLTLSCSFLLDRSVLLVPSQTESLTILNETTWNTIEFTCGIIRIVEAL